MSFDFLFAPVEHLDESLASLFEGAPIAVALGVAFLLGLRHATDPDHLMAVTALVARDESGTRSAARLGALWGAGHATALLADRPAADPARHRAAAGARVAPPRRPSASSSSCSPLRVLARWVHRNRQHDHDTARCARRARRSASASCTGSPAPAPSCCC